MGSFGVFSKFVSSMRVGKSLPGGSQADDAGAAGRGAACFEMGEEVVCDGKGCYVICTTVAFQPLLCMSDGIHALPVLGLLF